MEPNNIWYCISQKAVLTSCYIYKCTCTIHYWLFLVNDFCNTRNGRVNVLNASIFCHSKSLSQLISTADSSWNKIKWELVKQFGNSILVPRAKTITLMPGKCSECTAWKSLEYNFTGYYRRELCNCSEH